MITCKKFSALVGDFFGRKPLIFANKRGIIMIYQYEEKII